MVISDEISGDCEMSLLGFYCVSDLLPLLLILLWFFFICLKIADALYYNAALTLSILQKLGVATDLFALWFQMLQEVKKSGVRAHFKR